MGAPHGNKAVAAGLADRERAVCRVAGLGGLLQDGNSRPIAPQNANSRRSVNVKRPRLTRHAGAAHLR